MPDPTPKPLSMDEVNALFDKVMAEREAETSPTPVLKGKDKKKAEDAIKAGMNQGLRGLGLSAQRQLKVLEEEEQNGR